MIPQAHGGALLAGGMPGNKGGPGRPPNSETEFWEGCADDPAVQERIREVLKDTAHPQFAKLVMYANDRAKGKPRQMIQVQTMPTPVFGPLDGVEHQYLDEPGPVVGVSRQPAGSTDARA